MVDIFGFWKKRQEKKRRRSVLQLFLTGFAMGSADIVPGVSGGTIAFIFGVYEELLYSIKVVSGEALKLLVKGKFKQAVEVVPFTFLVPLGLGLLTAVVSLAKLISTLLENYPVLVWAFFFGLVVASVFVVGKRIVSWDIKDMVAVVLATVIAYIVVGAVPVETPETMVALFFSGALAISAMILPGVSGSFLLIIMGKYSQVLSAVVERDLVSLGVFGLGAIIGLTLFARVLGYLFEKHHDVVVAALTGVMIGSLRKIWPWKEIVSTRVNSHGVEVPLLTANILPESVDLTVVLAMVLAILAAGLIVVLEKRSVTVERVEDIPGKKFKKEHKRALKDQ